MRVLCENPATNYMPDTADQKVTVETQPPASLRWRSWPVRDNALRSSAVAAGLLVAALVVYVLTGRLLLVLLALAVMVSALWRFFLPVEFELGETGIGQNVFGRRRHIPWGAIRHYEICDAGVLLLPKAEGSLTPLQGLYLPWADHRDEVILRVRYYVTPQQNELRSPQRMKT